MAIRAIWYSSLLLVYSVYASAYAAPSLWEMPSNARLHSLNSGPGGPSLAPQPPFRFQKEVKGGTTPKIWVRDAAGRTWIVKFGQEVLADTFGPRLAWALGYHASPVYYVPSGKIAQFGAFRQARFKLVRPREDYIEGGWEWDHNPFILSHSGRRQLNGLKILVLLLSNWDAKDASQPTSNTAILRTGSTERFVLDDWGASLGGWGNIFTRDKHSCREFYSQNDDFVREAGDHGYLKWGYSGKHKYELTSKISTADVQWLLRNLDRLSDREIAAGLRSSGAGPQESLCFTRALRSRISRLQGAVRQARIRTRLVAER